MDRGTLSSPHLEMPADVDWVIQSYDGAEWVAEVHRRWDWQGEVLPAERITCL